MEEMEIFPTKLWRLVNDSDVDAIIWNHQGDGIILNMNLLENEFLPFNGFKGSSISSIEHQLNLHGFKKSEVFNDDEPNIHHYFHPNFQRSQPELLPLLRRYNQRPSPRVEDDLRNDLTERRDHRDLFDSVDDTRDANLNPGESFSVIVKKSIIFTLWK